MIQGPLRKQDWVDYPGKGELAWGFGWKKMPYLESHGWSALSYQRKIWQGWSDVPKPL